MLKIKLLVLNLIAVIFSSFSQAAVLDFEGLTTESAVNLNSVASNYGGFNWSDSFSLYNGVAFPAATRSGFYGVVNNDGVSPVSISSAATFDFDGLWLGSWPVNAPASVLVSGFDAASNLTDSVTLVLGDSAEIYVNANFTAVNRVELSGGQYFTLDDFTFSKRRSSVPDPSSFFLLGIGILALAAARHKSAA